VSKLNRKRGATTRPGFLVVGQKSEILERIHAYRAAGISKFVLIPIAQGDADLMEQTRRLVEEVIPSAEI
jgi:alkanesulfonate monooxygenase SsuD/methylene tetrahydromethanopterin reductase-like flavin-dependent oxidoreductase (luciferase family)